MKKFYLLICLYVSLFIQVCYSVDKLYDIDIKSGLLGAQDVWFESLSEQELLDHYSDDDSQTMSQKIQSLQTFHPKIYIDIRLVGFGGDGNLNLNLLPANLESYLRVAGHEAFMAQNIINPATGQKHSMSFGAKYIYRVISEKTSLHNRIHAEVESQVRVEAEMAFTAGPTEIPYQSVDDIIKQHYQAKGVTYTLYLLNLKPAVLSPADGANESIPVSYVYSSESSSCPSQHWVGGEERYAWLDLTAG